MSLVTRKNWNADAGRYETRLDADTRRTAFYDRAGCRSWIVQILDNDDNQIGDAEFYHAKSHFSDY